MGLSNDIGSLDVGKETHDAISGIRNEAGRETTQSVANQYNQRVMPQGLLQADDKFNSGLGAPDMAMSDAIRNKYAQKNAMQFEKLKQDNLMAAQGDHLKKLETATQLSAQELEMNRQKELLKYKMKQAKKAVRGQILGSVLGIAGGIGGAFAGGGAGAMAGAQIGQGAGQAIGSS